MAEEKTQTKIQTFHRPDWHPKFASILGNIEGQYAYVSEVGTIRLLGPLYEDPDISKFAMESEIEGPVFLLGAKSDLL